LALLFRSTPAKKRSHLASGRLPSAPAVHTLFEESFSMGQQANTGKSTKQQPAGKGQPQPKKGK
jgi:hypothetical protein